MPQTQPKMTAPYTNGSGIPVDNYEISDMVPSSWVQPSTPEVRSCLNAKKKGDKALIEGGKKYTPEETKVLAMFFIVVSEDPVTNNEQRVQKERI